jgi:hypothetical protein
MEKTFSFCDETGRNYKLEAKFKSDRFYSDGKRTDLLGEFPVEDIVKPIIEKIDGKNFITATRNGQSNRVAKLWSSRPNIMATWLYHRMIAQGLALESVKLEFGPGWVEFSEKEKNIDLFVTSSKPAYGGEPNNILGSQGHSAKHRHSYPYHKKPIDWREVDVFLDSGTFVDPLNQRLTQEAALLRLIRWKTVMSNLAEYPIVPKWVATYPPLIDETWVEGEGGSLERKKQRWDLKQAERAVAEAIESAQYFAQNRRFFAPGNLIFDVQGVDSYQYMECLSEIIKFASPTDAIGLGGWCILGMRRELMPEFWKTMWKVIPAIAASPVRHVHIFGVAYQPALGGLLALCDRYGLTLSSDSFTPIRATLGTAKGGHRKYWRDSIAYYQTAVSSLRQSRHYLLPAPEGETERIFWQVNAAIDHLCFGSPRRI